MNILILGDVVGLSGRKALDINLQKIIKDQKIDFTIINGENADDSGLGIIEENTKRFFDLGVDVITTGNHVWDKKETMNLITNEKRLLRPHNLVEGSPGTGLGFFETKNKKFKIGVINLMGNIFMKKSQNMFQTADKLKKA